MLRWGWLEHPVAGKKEEEAREARGEEEAEEAMGGEAAWGAIG